MDKFELAKKLNSVLKEYDYFEYTNNEYSELKALADIENNPDIVIEGLLEIIENLMWDRKDLE